MLHGMLDGQSSIGNISMPMTPETGNTQVSHSVNDMAVSLPTAVAGALDQSGKEPTMELAMLPLITLTLSQMPPSTKWESSITTMTLKIFGRLWIRNLMNSGKRMKNNQTK